MSNIAVLKMETEDEQENYFDEKLIEIIRKQLEIDEKLLKLVTIKNIGE